MYNVLLDLHQQAIRAEKIQCEADYKRELHAILESWGKINKRQAYYASPRITTQMETMMSYARKYIKDNDLFGAEITIIREPVR